VTSTTFSSRSNLDLNAETYLGALSAAAVGEIHVASTHARDLFTTGFTVERAFNGLDLAPDAPYARFKHIETLCRREACGAVRSTMRLVRRAEREQRG
jgi:hypothetical protein